MPRRHEYVAVDGNTGTVGITDHAQSQLGDVRYVELPEVGDAFEAEEAFGSVEQSEGGISTCTFPWKVLFQR